MHVTCHKRQRCCAAVIPGLKAVTIIGAAELKSLAATQFLHFWQLAKKQNNYHFSV